MKRARFSLLTLFLGITLVACCCGACVNSVVVLDSGSGKLARSRRVRCGCLSCGLLDRAGDGHGWLGGVWWYTEPADGAIVESPLLEVALPWSHERGDGSYHGTTSYVLSESGQITGPPHAWWIR